MLTGQAASDVGLPAIKWTDGAVGAGGVGSGSSDATAMPAGIALAANFDQAMAQRYGAVVGAEVRHRGFDGDFGPDRQHHAHAARRTYVRGLRRGSVPLGADRRRLDRRPAVAGRDGRRQALRRQQPGGPGSASRRWSAPTAGASSSTSSSIQRALHEIELPPFEAAVAAGAQRDRDVLLQPDQRRVLVREPVPAQTSPRLARASDGFVVVRRRRLPRAAGRSERRPELRHRATPATRAASRRRARGGQVSAGDARRARVRVSCGRCSPSGSSTTPTWPNDIRQDDRAGRQGRRRRHRGGRRACCCKNDGVLPIDPTKVHSIAVIGPAAEPVHPRQRLLAGDAVPEDRPRSQGIQARAARPATPVTYNDGTDASQAAGRARRAPTSRSWSRPTPSPRATTSGACRSYRSARRRGRRRRPNPQSTQLAFGDQDALIADVAAANPHTVVVLETGAPVLTPWRDQIAALLEAWYPGEDGGTAIAHVCSGDVDPGGRLPGDVPAASRTCRPPPAGPSQYPGVTDPTFGNCNSTRSAPCPYYQETYNEGVLVGYRWLPGPAHRAGVPVRLRALLHELPLQPPQRDARGRQPGQLRRARDGHEHRQRGRARRCPSCTSRCPRCRACPSRRGSSRALARSQLAPGQSAQVSDAARLSARSPTGRTPRTRGRSRPAAT